MKHFFTLLFLALGMHLAQAQYISEIDADQDGTDAMEFVEITGTPNAAMTGLSLALINGSDDATYNCIDLGGETFPSDGIFVIGSATVPNVDLVAWTTNGLQNGADAVALVMGACTAIDTPCGSIAGSILSSVIYDTNDGDDAALITCLGGTQINEDENNDSENESIQIDENGTVTVGEATPGADPSTPPTTPTCMLSNLIVTSVACDGDDLMISGSFDVSAGSGSYSITDANLGGTISVMGATDGTINFSGTLTGTISGGASTLTVTDLSGVASPTITAVSSATFQVNETGTIPSADYYGSGNDDAFERYSIATFNASNSAVTAINSAVLSLTYNDRGFTDGTMVEFFYTPDSGADLGGDFANLTFDINQTSGIGSAQFMNPPISLGVFPFDASIAGGSTLTYTLDLSVVGASLLAEVQNGSDFQIMVAATNDADDITFSGVGNNFDPGDPSLALDVTTASGSIACETGTSYALPTMCPAPADCSDLYIALVVDGDVTNGLPKMIKLCANDDIADLSLYGVGSANNGNGTDGVEFQGMTGALSAGQCVFLSSEQTFFTGFFGFPADYIAPAATAINGDDAIELFCNGSVVDTYGDPNVNGDNEPWDYTDSWAFRNTEVQNGGTFADANWTFGGRGALDALFNADQADPLIPCIPIVEVTDPCACGKDENLIVSGGTTARFYEVVQVTFLPAPTADPADPWMLVDVGTGQPIYATASGDPVASVPMVHIGGGVYEAKFWHEADAGYEAEVTNGLLTNPIVVTGLCAGDCPLIPTMGQWGLFILGLLMTSLGLAFMFNQRKAIA